MDIEDEKTEIPNCTNCGYRTEKKTLLGKQKGWCCFQERYLNNENVCSHYINEIDVGLGKSIYYMLLSSNRELTESEQKLYALVEQSIHGADERGCYIKATAEALQAMYQLGECYRVGINAPKDSRLAFFYYKMAANQRHPDAMFLVGLCYYFGIGVEKDEEQAFRWIDKASIENQPYAAYYAGEHDQKKGRISSAKGNFKIAARQGHAWAQYCLALIYWDAWGEGNMKAFNKGMFWCICAYLHGNDSLKASNTAKKLLDSHIQHGYPVEAVQRDIQQIKLTYPQYLKDPKPSWHGYLGPGG